MTIEEKLAKIAELASEVEADLEGIYKHADRLHFSKWQAGRMKLYALELAEQMELDQARQPYYFHGVETDITEPLFPEIVISLSQTEEKRLRGDSIDEPWKKVLIFTNTVQLELRSKPKKAFDDYSREMGLVTEYKPDRDFEADYQKAVEVAKKYVAIID